MRQLTILLEKLSRGETEMISSKLAARKALAEYRAEQQAAEAMRDMLWDVYNMLLEVHKTNAALNVRACIKAYDIASARAPKGVSNA